MSDYGSQLVNPEPGNGKSGGFKAFLKRKDIEFSFQRYGIEAMGAMALGLFASLLIGTIIQTLGQQLANAFGANAFTNILVGIGGFAIQATGPAMAVAIGSALKAKGLVLFSLAGVGLAANTLGGAGGPIAVLIVTIVAAECGKAIYKETPIDIIVSPFVTLMVGIGLSAWWAPAIGSAAQSVGTLVNWATLQQPLIMSVVISVVIGIALTLPISSAAICAGIGLVGIAGGAALAGCCAQMVGFAVMSYPENKSGGLLAQGLGTSMLQMPNILKNPLVWIPPTLASAITGPIATLVFKIEMNGPPLASGMGTSGLVGPIGVITGWFSPSERALEFGATPLQPTWFNWLGLFLISIILPALLTWLIAIPMRKKGLIKYGDLDLGL